MPEINFQNRGGLTLTRKQAVYIDILFDDCGFSPTQKRAKLEADFGVRWIDELTLPEASKLIEELKSYKEES